MEPTNPQKSDTLVILFFLFCAFIVFVVMTGAVVFGLKVNNISSLNANDLERIFDTTTSEEEQSKPKSTTSDIENKHINIDNINVEETSSIETRTSPTTTIIINRDTQTNTTTTPVKQTVQPTAPSCTRFVITQPSDLKSDKCYYTQDYYNIQTYYSRYNSAKSEKSWAESGTEITCDDKDFFGDACDDYKDTRDKANTNMEKYKSLILELIKKGK